MIVVAGMEFERQPFKRSSWGPLRLAGQQWGAEVTVPGGPTVAIDFRKVRKPETVQEERLGSLDLGLPIVVDGVVRAMATSTGRDAMGWVRPGRIRVDGDDPELVPPGLTLRGHLLPQRLTLESDAGPLVWSPWPWGLANVHAGPLLVVPPRVAPEALPFHLALWLVAWRGLEGQF